MNQPPENPPPPGAPLDPPPPGSPAGGQPGGSPWGAPPGGPSGPGWAQAPPGQAPPYPQPGPPPGAPAPGTFTGAAHKPGAIALRPLGLGDIYDGSFRIIRYNPKATVGFAALVSAVLALVPAVIAVIVNLAVDTTTLADSGDPNDPFATSTLDVVSSLLNGLGAIFVSIGGIFVTAVVAKVAHAAAVGRRVSLAEGWEATRGKRWRMVGLLVLTGVLSATYIAIYALLWVVVVVVTEASLGALILWGVLSGIVFVVLGIYLYTRFIYLAPPTLMLDDVGVFGSLTRSSQLIKGNWWRTFGIGILTVLITQFASSILVIPVTLAGTGIALAAPDYALSALVISQSLATVVAIAFVAPFTSAVASLQYLDLRMRKEAYDIELMTEAGIIT